MYVNGFHDIKPSAKNDACFCLLLTVTYGAGCVVLVFGFFFNMSWPDLHTLPGL